MMMKKQLLTVACFGVVGGLFAQSSQANFDPKYEMKKPKKEIKYAVDNGYNFVKDAHVNPKPSTASNKAAVTTVNMGNSTNAYTCGFGPKQYLWADPNLNAVTFTHRLDATTSSVPNSGHVGFDISTDGGATFTSNIKVYDGDDVSYSQARYPQGGIYNPQGNTTISNANFFYTAPTLDGNNNSWGGMGYGTATLPSGGSPTMNEDHSGMGNSHLFLIGGNYSITDGGAIWHVMDEGDGANNYDYTDSLILSKSTDGGATWTRWEVFAPVSNDNTGASNFVDVNIAFSQDGMTGYIAMLGHYSYTTQPDSAFYPIVYKTTDGGNTWSSAIEVDIWNLAGVQNALFGAPGTTVPSYTTGFELDMVLDNNNNPHIVCAVGAYSGTQGWSISTGPGNFGIFDINSTDGGSTWVADFITYPQTFRGTFGDPNGNYIPEDNRAQVARTWDGTKLFYAIFDTDTNTFGSQDGNWYPDAWVISRDLTTGKWTCLKNATAGSNADGVTTFGNMAYYVFEPSAGTYEIPLSYQTSGTIQTDVLQTTQHVYISGVQFVDADYNDCPLSINEINKFGFEVYPNPTTGLVNIILDQTDNYTINVVDVLGKVVDTQKINGVRATVDLSGLNTGVYFVNIKNDKTSITERLVLTK
ncbi:MAG: hypothetical protein Kow0079_07040 [Vicingaceae bacterium]